MKKSAGATKGGAQAKKEEPVQVEEEVDIPQTGNGKFEYMNQTIYEGDWRQEKGRKFKHGKGKIMFPGAQGMDSGHEEYEGEWVNDKMHGHGRYLFTSGAVYTGQWVEGVIQGAGKMVYADGTSYEGTWERSQMNGEGNYVDADGVKWTGIFVNGSFESKVQKKLLAEKEQQDRINLYRTKAMVFFKNWSEAFAKSDKKTFKENLTPCFANADTCGEFVKDVYAKYEERPPDKWNEFLNSFKAGTVRVLATRDEAKLLKIDSIVVEQMRSKLGGQIAEIDGTVGDKPMTIAICELPTEHWVLLAHGERQV